jgi:hypothetical protein
MNRRGFLETTAAIAATGTLGNVIAPSTRGMPSTKPMPPWPVAAGYSVAEHRRRLENIARCRAAIRSCVRRHVVSDYLPAQCCYNLGEYPDTKPWSLEAYDEQELDRLRDHGIQSSNGSTTGRPAAALGATAPGQRANAPLHRLGPSARDEGVPTPPAVSQRTDPDGRGSWGTPWSCH